MTHQDTPHLSTSTAAESYSAQSDDTMFQYTTPGPNPGRPSVGVSVWTKEDWGFFINAISQEVPSWMYDEQEFLDTTSIDQSIGGNEFGARTRYPFGDLSVYKVPERPCQPYFNAWTPGHKGRIVLAVTGPGTDPGPSGSIDIMDFEVGKVLNSGEFTVSVWGYATVGLKEGTSYIWIDFDGEESPLKVECCLFEKSVTIDPAAFVGYEGVGVSNIHLLLGNMLEAGALS